MLVSKSRNVGKKLGQNVQMFSPQNVGDSHTDRPSDLRYKITPHSDILAKVLRAAFFGLED